MPGTIAPPTANSQYFVPYQPVMRLKPFGRLAQLWHLANNPIKLWVKHHYETPIGLGPALLGTVAIVNDPAAIRHILVENSANYEKDALQMRVLSAGAPQDAAKGLLIARGEHWRRARRIMAPLFTPRRVSSFSVIMSQRARDRVNSWQQRPAGTLLDIDREMSGLTYDILSATLFSDSLEGNAAEVEQQMRLLLNSIGRIHPFDIFNAPAWVPRIGQGKGRKSRQYFETAMSNLLASRMAEADAGTPLPDDLLSALITAKDPETGEGLEHDEIVANLFTFIAAGHETTARALAWTLYLISRAPQWEERCIAEAKNAPDDPAKWLDAMPAIRAAFEEAMRLFPPAPQLSRVALADDVLVDTPIKAGTLVIIAPWVLHRHRTLWDQPDAFVPERFMPGNRDSIDRFAYLPFGGGPRVCIGQTFAVQEAVIILANILMQLRLQHDGPQPEPLHRITLRPHQPLRMTIKGHQQR